MDVVLRGHRADHVVALAGGSLALRCSCLWHRRRIARLLFEQMCRGRRRRSAGRTPAAAPSTARPGPAAARSESRRSRSPAPSDRRPAPARRGRAPAAAGPTACPAESAAGRAVERRHVDPRAERRLVNRHRQRQMQVAPARRKNGCSATSIVTYRSPAGPPRAPAWPRPGTATARRPRPRPARAASRPRCAPATPDAAAQPARLRVSAARAVARSRRAW